MQDVEINIKEENNMFAKWDLIDACCDMDNLLETLNEDLKKNLSEFFYTRIKDDSVYFLVEPKPGTQTEISVSLDFLDDNNAPEFKINLYDLIVSDVQEEAFYSIKSLKQLKKCFTKILKEIDIAIQREEKID